MTEVNIPTFKLNNGQDIPAVGYGTWLGLNERFEFDMSQAPQLKEAMAYAIDVGYRHIDTAHLYRVEPEVGQVVNKKIEEKVVKREDLFITTKLYKYYIDFVHLYRVEPEVGQVVNKKIEEKVVKREDLLITTKVWHHFHREGDVEVSLRGSLRRLNMDYVDMVLMHWPMSISEEGVDEKIDYLETWRGFEAVLAKGLTKGIGVSNFNVDQLKRLLANCKVKPACNQVELNINLCQPELVSYCQSNSIIVVGYSPFGTMIPSRLQPNSPEPKIDNPVMGIMSRKYGKTVPQIALRYLYQRGIVVIPKTVTKARVLENASIFDFHIDQADFEELEKFNVDYRTVRPSFWQDYQNWPFDKVERTLNEIPLALRKWKNGINLNID